MKPMTSILLVLVFAMGCYALGCSRQEPFEDPPIHLIRDMDQQPSLPAFSQSDFFSDGSGMRLQVPGTVARGHLRADDQYFKGLEVDGSWVVQSPEKATLTSIQRGQERYMIFCTPCHGEDGQGQGIISQKGMFPPPSLHEERLREVADGTLFDVIGNGFSTMSGLGQQVPVDDRWAIVHAIRFMQEKRVAVGGGKP